MVVDPEPREQPLGCGAVERLRRLDGLASPVTQQEPPVHGELVALGVPAEVVVVVEDQDRRVRHPLPVEPRRGEPADARSDDHQIHVVGGCDPLGIEPPAIADGMRRLERSDVAATETRPARRVGAPVDELLPRNMVGHHPTPAGTLSQADRRHVPTRDAASGSSSPPSIGLLPSDDFGSPAGRQEAPSVLGCCGINEPFDCLTFVGQPAYLAWLRHPPDAGGRTYIHVPREGSEMASRIGAKKGLWIGGLAIAALLVATAIPGLAAASQRTIALAITSPTTAAANTSVVFHAKVTNNSPVGSVSNPSSLRVTVPLGFTVTDATLATQASGESTNANPSAVIISTQDRLPGTVTVNSIKPLQRLEFVTVLITATTPNISGTCQRFGDTVRFVVGGGQHRLDLRSGRRATVHGDDQPAADDVAHQVVLDTDDHDRGDDPDDLHRRGRNDDVLARR